MTKKDYIVIARVINTYGGLLQEGLTELGQLDKDQKVFADKVLYWLVGRLSMVLEEENPRFDNEKFLGACFSRECGHYTVVEIPTLSGFLVKCRDCDKELNNN